MSPRRRLNITNNGSTPEASTAKRSGETASPPKKKKKPMRLGDLAAATRDLSNANSTLNTFIGGRPRSWMWADNAGQRPEGSVGRTTNRAQSGKLPKNKPNRTTGEPIPQSGASPAEHVPLLATVAPGDHSSQPAFSWSNPSPQNTLNPTRKSRTARDSVLPSPAPSHSPPTLEHRQLGQPTDRDSRPRPNLPEPTTAPTDGANEPPAPPSTNAITTLSTYPVESQPSESDPNRLSRKDGELVAGLKRSVDSTAEGSPRALKRTMTEPATPQNEAPVETPTPLIRMTEAPDRRASVPGLQAPSEMAPAHSPATHSPQITASLTLRSNSIGSTTSTSPSMAYRSAAGQVQRPSTPQTTPFPANHSTSNQSIAMLGFSPAHTPLPSPGPSPLRQTFPLASNQPLSTYQLLQTLNAFRQKAQLSGGSLTEDELLRLNLLKEAVIEKDWVFLCLHQAYIALSLCPDLLSKETGLSMSLPGWAAIRYFLRDNTMLSRECQQFFVSFPQSMESGYMRQQLQMGGNAKLLEQFLMEHYKMMLAMRKFCIENRRKMSEQEVTKLIRVRSTVLVKVVTARIQSEIEQGHQRAAIQSNIQLQQQQIMQQQHRQQQHQQQQQMQPQLHQRQQPQQQPPQQQIATGGQRVLQRTVNTITSPGYFSFGSSEVGNAVRGIGHLIQGQRRGSQPISPGTMLQQPSQMLPSQPMTGLTPDMQRGGRQCSTAIRRGSGPRTPFPVGTGAFPQGLAINAQQPTGVQPQYNPYGLPQSRAVNALPLTRPPPRPQRAPQGQLPGYPTNPAPAQGSTRIGGPCFPPIPENILQSHLISPVMSPVGQPNKLRKLHLTVVDFPVRRLSLSAMCQMGSFDVSTEAERCLSRLTPAPRAGELPRRPIHLGSLIYRLRCVEIKPGKTPPATDAEWVILETTWPKNFFVEINNRQIEIRRKLQWGKDLPADITNLLQPGLNDLKAVSLASSSNANSPAYMLSVEILQCVDEDTLKSRLQEHCCIPAEKAEAKILSRLAPAAGGDDDDIIVSSSTVTIDIFCPLSFKSIALPVRGRACRHIECFDYDTFMQSRPRKRERDPPHGDGYRCPHCGGDARPGELEVDGFMLEVLQRVKTDFKEGAVRSIVMDSTGQWEAKKEAEDKEDEEDDEEGTEREVICIDD